MTVNVRTGVREMENALQCWRILGKNGNVEMERELEGREVPNRTYVALSYFLLSY